MRMTMLGLVAWASADEAAAHARRSAPRTVENVERLKRLILRPSRATLYVGQPPGTLVALFVSNWPPNFCAHLARSRRVAAPATRRRALTQATERQRPFRGF